MNRGAIDDARGAVLGPLAPQATGLDPATPRVLRDEKSGFIARRGVRLPLPEGEGWGEGKEAGRTVRTLRMGIDVWPGTWGFTVLSHLRFHACASAQLAETADWPIADASACHQYSRSFFTPGSGCG